MLRNMHRNNIKNTTEQKPEIHLIGPRGIYLKLFACLGTKESELYLRDDQPRVMILALRLLRILSKQAMVCRCQHTGV